MEAMATAIREALPRRPSVEESTEETPAEDTDDIPESAEPLPNLFPRS